MDEKIDNSYFEVENSRKMRSGPHQVSQHHQNRSNKLSVWETCITLLSSSVGVVVIGTPYAFYRLGIPLAVVALLVLSFLGYSVAMLMLKTKDLTPQSNQSLYEIGYLLFGRPSIFIVTIAHFVVVFLALVMYYIACGDVLSVLAKQVVLVPTLGISVEEIDDKVMEDQNFSM